MSNQEINKDSVQKFLDSLENTLGTRKIDVSNIILNAKLFTYDGQHYGDYLYKE